MKKVDIIKHFGSVKKTAKALKLTPAAIYAWPEVLTEGRASRVNLVIDSNNIGIDKNYFIKKNGGMRAAAKKLKMSTVDLYLLPDILTVNIFE